MLKRKALMESISSNLHNFLKKIGKNLSATNTMPMAMPIFMIMPIIPAAYRSMAIRIILPAGITTTKGPNTFFVLKDWTGKHFRFKNGQITVIYDWDSLGYMSLFRCIASAALTFPYNDEIGLVKFSSHDDLLAFLQDYQMAGGFRFEKRVVQLISAYCTYHASYICKCLCTLSDDRKSIEYMEGFNISQDLRKAEDGLYFGS